MKSRGGHRIAIGIACAVVATAAAFEGCLSFGDLQGNDGGTSDASSDSGSPIDSGTDSEISDSSTTDAYVFFDGSSGVRFCATQIDAAFCDDFDQLDAAPLALWQPPNTSNGGSVMLTSTGLSAPNALVAGVTANGNALLIPANVSHQLTGSVNVAHYAYDFLVDFYDMSGSSAYIGPIDERVGLADTEVRLVLNASGLLVGGVVTPGDGGASTFPALSTKVAVSGGVWHHADIYVDYTQMPAVVTFTLDSTMIANHVPIPGSIFGAGNVTVEAGFLYVSSPTSGWKLRVDDVAVFTE